MFTGYLKEQKPNSCADFSKNQATEAYFAYQRYKDDKRNNLQGPV